MNYKVDVAKNGEYTLILNDIYIYSKYNPRKDAEKFINKEYDNDAKCYFLVGLGLGYHLEALLQMEKNKPIIVLAIDEQDITMFKRYSKNPQMMELNNVKIILETELKEDLNLYQIIIPFSWMKALGGNHRFYNLLEDIKIRQMSYEAFSELLDKNFQDNLKNNDPSISELKNVFKGKLACLVSSGPSLDSTIELLRDVKDRCYVLAVGSALNTLLKNNIKPDAVIIIDSQINVVKQLKNKVYKGLLFYLSTSNHEMTLVHEGKRIIIFQEGFNPAEIEAKKTKVEVLETGGSVATTGFSLLEYMGFQSVVLFGQDFGFKGDSTHSILSTSRKNIVSEMPFRKVLANNGEYIHTTANLSTYLRWFERKANKTNVKIYNSSWTGAKINGIPYLDEIILNIILRNL